ncbi:hypothetical protein [Leptospira stimsonii]|uniref:Uncharacterized protein n=1 Tax=Leptospira stimsonii TaxID=2202203 RepID=A0ABY2MX07_9LEPT|nr:hypothetical protein [Leptospira stimsonii]TGK23820.1 hypothetical protein EHO98_03935 [Leptospira stimsonii]TGM10472.1 hypothetical protein EHQ90_18585 [Leptospira stimsonii]
MKRILLFLLLIGFDVLAVDWEFSSTNIVIENNKKMILSGRVKGPECKKLRIVAKAQNESGEKRTLIGIVEALENEGSRLFTIAESIYSKRIENWTLLEISARCQSK